MTTPNFKSYWDEKRALLDSRIEIMEESLRALKEERNTCSCAIRVPPEILTHIFLDVITDIYKRGWKPIGQFHLPHVCRYWYDVALKSQEYWRYQPLYNGGRLRPLHLMDRAEGRPLYLTGTLSVDFSDWISPKCDHFLSQAESVDILLCHNHPSSSSSSLWSAPDDPSVPEYLEDFLKRGAPNLKSLTLSAEDVSITPRIPDDAFDGNIPCLRFLALFNVECSWLTSIFVSSLTHLTLQGRIFMDDACIQTLQRLSSLRHLYLADLLYRDGLHIPPFEPPTAPPSVKLEHLEVLCVRGEGYPLGVLALELDIPLSTSVILVPEYPERLMFDPPHECLALESLLSWLPKHLQKLDLGSIPLNTMHLESRLDWDLKHNRDTGVLRLYHSPDSIVDPVQLGDRLPKAECARYLEVRFYLQGRCFPLHVILPVIIPKLQLSTVQVLYLDDIYCLNVETALGSLTGVHTLCLSGGESTDVLQNLIPTKPRREALLPALKTLILHKIGLDGRFTHALSFVADRSEQYPVEKVYLSQCEHVREEYLESLRQHVSTVEWDGLDQECYGGTLRLRPGIRVMGRRS
ncbi:hypothetical protein NLI96_g944 [Meripilus lineatus]|uniref:F-box domain-containing protein n=1 Tax=Meripilus lineatus TaxID=2056292 RepID=A0AAD5VCV1_9APHY|nr:hypothetical protein NLI96_g944 [Physisporinus lineatus]